MSSTEEFITPTSPTELSNQVNTLTRIIDDLTTKKNELEAQIASSQVIIDTHQKKANELSDSIKNSQDIFTKRQFDLDKKQSDLDLRMAESRRMLVDISDKQKSVVSEIENQNFIIAQAQEEQTKLKFMQAEINRMGSAVALDRMDFEKYKDTKIAELTNRENTVKLREDKASAREAANEGQATVNKVEQDRLAQSSIDMKTKMDLIDRKMADTKIVVDSANEISFMVIDRLNKVSDRETLTSAKEVFLAAKEKELLGYKQQLLMEQARIKDLANKNAIPMNTVIL